MTAVPPKISKISPVNLWFAGIILSVAILAAGAMVYFFNPTTHAFYPLCQFHQLTGLNCPGCGATRALYALLHGNFSVALRDNALMLVGGAAAAARGGWVGINRLRGRANGDFFPNHLLVPVLVVIGVFGVLRNLPAFAFLSP